MAQAEVQTPPSIVQTELNYYLDPSHGGSDVLYLGTAGYYRRKHDGRRVDITDMRSVVGASEGFSLDTQGFELVTHPPPPGIINVWRPLQPVRREPLALCDARSVRESDLRPVTAVLPRRGSAAFELCQVAAAGAGAAAHSWWYASRMTPDEALLIKIYDSKLGGRALRVPHTAFAAGDDSGPPRQSIEVRCLVFWEDQDRE